MKNLYYITILLILLIVIAGCSYSFYMSAYPYLETIKITEFKNETDQYDLEIEIIEYMSNIFNSENRLRTVDINPDAELSGKVINYESDNIIDFDKNQLVEQYELKITFSLVFTDLVNNQVLWQSDNLTISEQYYPNSEEQTITTEQQARDEIFSKLYDKLIKNTLEKW